MIADSKLNQDQARLALTTLKFLLGIQPEKACRALVKTSSIFRALLNRKTSLFDIELINFFIGMLEELGIYPDDETNLFIE